MSAVTHAVPQLRRRRARLVATGSTAPRTALESKRHPLFPLVVKLRLPPQHVGVQLAEGLDRGHRRARRRHARVQSRMRPQQLLALEPVEVREA